MSIERWKIIESATRAAIESGELQPGDRLPSATVVATQWSVSRMTAHRALSELQRQGLVVRRSRAGTVVAERRRERTGYVALLFDHTNQAPQAEYLRGIHAGLPDDNHLILCDTRKDAAREEYYLKRMSKRADGIIIYPTCDAGNTPLLQQTLDSGIPIVCVDRAPANLNIDAVITDNYSSSLNALRIMRGRGHERLAHFTEDALDISSVRERHRAYLDAMTEAGVSDAERLVRLFPPLPEDRLGQLTQLVHDALFTLLRGPNPPTAVFCLNDCYMTAVLEARDQLGAEVVRNLEVLSFTDSPLPESRHAPAVHRIVQHVYVMGQMATTRLQARLQGDDGPPCVQRVPADFYPTPAYPP